jgi:hypothetical protein
MSQEEVVQQSPEETLEAAPQEGEEVVAEAASEEAGEAKKEEAAAVADLKRKFKLKVGGKEIEEELDLNDNDSITRYLQKAKAFDQKAEELALTRKETQQLLAALKENPSEVLRMLGHDIDDLAYNHLKQAVEESKKTPEQIEIERIKKENEEFQNKLKGLEEEKQTAETERLRNEQASIIQNDILSALKENKESILSVEDPEIVGDVARAMHKLMLAGHEDVTVQDVLPIVEERYINKLRKRLELMDDGAVEKALGKTVTERLRKKRIQAAKKAEATTTANQIKETGVTGKKQEAPVEKKTYKEFFRGF